MTDLKTGKAETTKLKPETAETTIKALEDALRKANLDRTSLAERVLSLEERNEVLQRRSNELSSSCKTLSETNSRLAHDKDFAEGKLGEAEKDLAMLVGVLHARGLPLPPLVIEPYASMARDAGKVIMKHSDGEQTVGQRPWPHPPVPVA